jgi:hypothetical protein
MKISFISKDEVTIDLNKREMDVLEAGLSVLEDDPGAFYKNSDVPSEVAEMVTQFKALRVLLKAHSTGWPA